MSGTGPYPKILLLGGEAMSSATATGITLRNLFAGYPVEKIAAVFSTTFDPDWQCAGRYYRINQRDVCGLKGHGRRYLPPFPDASSGMNPGNTPPPGALKGLLRKTALEVLEWFSLTVSPELELFLDDFAPDIVYTLGAQTQIMRLAESISVKRNLPVVLHFMDNWIETRYAGALHSFSRKKMLGALDRLMKRSSLFMTISPEMAEAYRTRFRMPGHPFMNCIPTREYRPPAEPGDDPLKIYYIGGLHLQRGETIGQVAKVLREDADLKNRFRIVVFAPEKDWKQTEALHGDPLVEYGGNLPYRQVSEKTTEADILLHVEAFAPEITDYTRLSISTKLVEYFMAGRVVLGVAPKHLASIREIERAGCFSAVTEEEIAEALRKLSSPETRQNGGKRAYEYALETHSAEKVHERFLKVFQQAWAK